jgi:hypothetical protein
MVFCWSMGLPTALCLSVPFLTNMVGESTSLKNGYIMSKTALTAVNSWDAGVRMGCIGPHQHQSRLRLFWPRITQRQQQRLHTSLRMQFPFSFSENVCTSCIAALDTQVGSS